MDLERTLHSVGKAIFVKYYYFFKDDTHYSNSDLIEIISENYTDKSKKSRTGHARMIFRNNLNIEALEIIIKSKVSEGTKLAAQELIQEEKNP
ncbi:hypothetical protein IJ707_03900 [bacterium]|nr:hypothetical protein [bacterium]